MVRKIDEGFSATRNLHQWQKGRERGEGRGEKGRRGLGSYNWLAASLCPDQYQERGPRGHQAVDFCDNG